MLDIADINIVKRYPRHTQTQLELKRIVRRIHYYKMQLQKANMYSRKQDARQKIMMGGLIIKAGLEDLYNQNPAIIFGLLLEAKNRIDNETASTAIIEQWQRLGLNNIS